MVAVCDLHTIENFKLPFRTCPNIPFAQFKSWVDATPITTGRACSSYSYASVISDNVPCYRSLIPACFWIFNVYLMPPNTWLPAYLWVGMSLRLSWVIEPLAVWMLCFMTGCATCILPDFVALLVCWREWLPRLSKNYETLPTELSPVGHPRKPL